MNFKKICIQGFKFIIVSGIGWLIDFSIYLFLTIKLNLIVGYANFISGIPAITFVFFISTQKIFKNKLEGIGLKKKYFMYFIYQIFLMLAVSWIGQLLYKNILSSDIFFLVKESSYLKIIIKIIITPITMFLNFCVMKLLTEKY
ncbi:GtrA family protein [Clostridium butyricum]|uniref:GtrA family protein n=1 Tax=Clostridium butyricum TaxID=1492 RepID=UPI0032C00D3C